MTEETGKKENQKPKAKKKIKPKIVMRGTSKFWAHHFKASLSNMLKNRSYQYGVLKIEKLEHVHMFHSKNSQGKAMPYTAPVGGHFHEVTISKDDEGNIIAECGPALQYVHKKLPNGRMKKSIQKLAWYDAEKDEKVYDDHKHEMEYLDSEHLSPAKIKADREANAKHMKEFMGNQEDEDYGI